MMPQRFENEKYLLNTISINTHAPKWVQDANNCGMKFKLKIASVRQFGN